MAKHRRTPISFWVFLFKLEDISPFWGLLAPLFWNPGERSRNIEPFDCRIHWSADPGARLVTSGWAPSSMYLTVERFYISGPFSMILATGAYLRACTVQCRDKT